jgi:uncharacterized protein YwgA
MDTNKLGAILKELGIDVYEKHRSEVRSSFLYRFLIQKALFFISRDHKYYKSYNIYVHGPYSPELTKDLYSLIDNNTPQKNISFSETEKQTIDKTKQIIRKILSHDEMKKDQVLFLETISTLLFLIDKKDGHYEQDQDSLYKVFNLYKPFIDKNTFDMSLVFIKEEKLVS